jgi:hypothetical protein
MCLWSALAYDPADPLSAARQALGFTWPPPDDWIHPILNEPLLEDFMSHPEILGGPLPCSGDPALADTMSGRRASLAELFLARFVHVRALWISPENGKRFPLAAVLLRHPEAWGIRVRWPFGNVPEHDLSSIGINAWNGILQWGRRTLPFPMAIALAVNDRLPQGLKKPARHALIHAGLKGFAASGQDPGILLDRIGKHMKYLLKPLQYCGFSMEELRETARLVEISRSVKSGVNSIEPVL